MEKMNNPFKIFIGPIFLSIGLWFLIPNLCALLFGAEVNGIVKEIKIETYKENTGSSYTLYKATIDFTIKSGDKYQYFDSSGTQNKNKWHIGQKVPMVYLQIYPRINTIKDWGEILFPWVFLVLLGAIFLTYSVISIKKNK